MSVNLGVETWSAQDVMRAHVLACDMYVEQTATTAEVEMAIHEKIAPRARLQYSRRASKTTAADYANRDELLNRGDRLAPVVAVDAGYIATQEARSWVTLVSD